jgi:glutathione synthase/RimK-type ligase-like ATP-grasp enzyme
VVEPEPDEIRIAEDVCRALGLKLAGVDVARVTATLPGRDELGVGDVFFIEANVFPAITRMSRITNLDVADLVVASILHELEFRHHLVA